MSSGKRKSVRWLLPGICLVCAGMGLIALVVMNHSGDHQPSGRAALEVDRGKTPPPAGTNQTPTNSEAVNPSEADTAEDRVVALITEGNQLLGRGNYAEAARKYEQAVRIDPEDENLHYNLAIALARQGKTEEAKRRYTEALRIFPEYADAHNNLGNLLMNESNWPEAIVHFEEAIKLMPENASFHNNLGTAFGRQGKVADAMKAFSEAVRLRPAYVEARVNLGNSCLAAGRVEEAVTQLEEALRLQPDFQPAIQAMRRASQKQASSRE